MDKEVQARTTGPAVPPVERSDRVPIGLRVRGRYRIVSELGTGAFGTVCVAQDESTGHGVAIRLLPRAFVGAPHAAQAFLRMGRSIISASASHPGLVRVLEFGEIDGGRPFAVTELVEGRRLSEMIAEGNQLDIGAALRLALDLGGAVETLHNMGFIHGALSPRNVMVLDDGRLKLLDVELAGLRDAREIQGVVTPEPAVEYLSPEQILKAPVNEKTDIYAFGAIIYELLCGFPPFHGGPREAIVAKHLKETPLSIHRRRNDVPGSVERAITLALYKQPEPRPLMGDVLNLLWTGAHGPAPRRKRTVIVAAGASLAAAAVVAIVWGSLALRSPAPPSTPPTARPAIDRAPASTPPVAEPRPAPVVRPPVPAVVTPAPAERMPAAERAPASVTPAPSAPVVESRPPLPRPPAPAAVTPPAPVVPPAALVPPTVAAPPAAQRPPVTERAPIAERPPVSPAPTATAPSAPRPAPEARPAPSVVTPAPAAIAPPAPRPAPEVKPAPPAVTPVPPVVTPAPPVPTPPAPRVATPPATTAPASTPSRVEPRPEPRAPQAPAASTPQRPAGVTDPEDPRAVIDWLFSPGGRQ